MGKKSREKKQRRALRLNEGILGTSINEDLHAAHDYRGQQQARFSSLESSRFTEQLIRRWPEAVKHLTEVFPSEKIDFTIDVLNVTVETSHDDPLTHSQISRYGKLVSDAARRIGLPLHGGISAGAIDCDGLDAMQQKVMMTDASVVMVSVNLSLMLHRLSKLLALTVPINSFGVQYKISENIDEYKKKYNQDKILREHWLDFFYEYSRNRISPELGKKIVMPTRECAHLMSALSESMLTFITAHEFSHHIAKHELQGLASVEGESKEAAQNKELEADMFGAHLCMEIGNHEDISNFFCIANVGAVTTLLCLEFFRIGEKILSEGIVDSSPQRDTHPHPEIRIRAIKQVARELAPSSAKTIFRAQDLFAEFMEFVWKDAEEMLLQSHAKGVRPVSKTNGDWLPN